MLVVVKSIAKAPVTQVKRPVSDSPVTTGCKGKMCVSQLSAELLFELIGSCWVKFVANRYTETVIALVTDVSALTTYLQSNKETEKSMMQELHLFEMFLFQLALKRFQVLLHLSTLLANVCLQVSTFHADD